MISIDRRLFMKKPLLFCVLALSLASCDLSSFLPNNKSNNGGNSEKRIHDGVALTISCSEDMGLKRVQDNEYVTNLVIEPQNIGISTIKRLENHITFYKPPVFGQAQLEEITKDETHTENYFVEAQVNFIHADDNTKLDFVYLTSIEFSSKDENNVFYKYLRVAVFDKEEMIDTFVLSKDQKGEVTKTEYNLDLNMDGKLDGDPDPINYTTGMPLYVTDNWELDIPTQREIDTDEFDPFHQRLNVANNKAITFRMWIEGWELDNNVVPNNAQIDVNLKFAGHVTK